MISAGKLFLKFLQVEERLCTPYFLNSDLVLLHSQLHSFMKSYFEVFEDAKLKPKSHYLQHYPQMIKAFGPLFKTLNLNKDILIQHSVEAKTKRIFVTHV